MNPSTAGCLIIWGEAVETDNVMPTGEWGGPEDPSQEPDRDIEGITNPAPPYTPGISASGYITLIK